MPKLPALAACLLLVHASCPPTLTAQCTTEWQAMGGLPGLNDIAHAMLEWDPDGTGPMTPVVVVGGDFTIASDVEAPYIASYDPATGQWRALANSVTDAILNSPAVHGLAVLPSGELLATGSFSAVDGIVSMGAVRTGGVTWQAVGGIGVAWPPIYSKPLVMANGDLIVTGSFAWAIGNTVNNITRWNGSNWQPLGGGLLPAGFGIDGGRAMAVLPGGELVVAGSFDNAGGNGINTIASWNGTQWAALGSSNSLDGTVHALLTLPGGDLLAGGEFTITGSTLPVHVARWNGSSWSPFGGDANGTVHCLAQDASGDVYVGGTFSSLGGMAIAHLGHWDGTSWTSLAGGLDGPCQSLLVTSNQDVYASGNFRRAGSAGAARIARFDGIRWHALAPGFPRQVTRLLPLHNGGMLVGGDFEQLNGMATGGIAHFDGANWQALGNNALHHITALHQLASGDVLAAGQLGNGSQSTPDVHRWNGTAWTSLAVNEPIHALIEMPNGDLVVGGDFQVSATMVGNNIQMFNGTIWQPLGLGTDGPIHVMTLAANGDLLVGGLFQHVDAQPTPAFARWDGSTWHSYPAGNPQTSYGGGNVTDIEVLANGDVLLTGMFNNLLWRAAIWNGTNWVAPSLAINAFAQRLQPLPNSDMVFAGGFFDFTGTGSTANHIMRWTGSTSVPFGTGTDDIVRDVAMDRRGDLWVAGDFNRVHGAVAAKIARIATTCPPNVVSYGSGCLGSAGLVQLAPTTQAWIGATYEAVASGLPQNAFLVTTRSLSQIALPLAPLLPQAQPGCQLLTGLEVLDVLPVLGPTAAIVMAVPLDAALIGRSLHQQVLPIELDAVGNIVAITSSNALTVTFGTF